MALNDELLKNANSSALTADSYIGKAWDIGGFSKGNFGIRGMQFFAHAEVSTTGTGAGIGQLQLRSGTGVNGSGVINGGVKTLWRSVSQAGTSWTAGLEFIVPVSYTEGRYVQFWWDEVSGTVAAVKFRTKLITEYADYTKLPDAQN